MEQDSGMLASTERAEAQALVICHGDEVNRSAPIKSMLHRQIFFGSFQKYQAA
jgi:hypothetical protein